MVRWSIGNGTNIKVMSEPWLREANRAWISSPQDQGVYNFYVNDLLLPDMKIWDREKIESIFPMYVAKRILEVPLFNMVDEDKLIWTDSTNGNYSVKSGYKLIMNITGKVDVVSSKKNWNSLWTILAPPKAKHLLWRISIGCLPTRLRLQERRVPCPLLCPICEQHDEDDWHVMFGCAASTQAMQATDFGFNLEAYLQQTNSVSDIILELCLREDKEAAGLKASHFWEDWFSVQQVQYGGSQYNQQQPLMWQKPNYGWYKCNVDAGFHKEISKTSAGRCLCDHMRRFVMAETTWVEGNCTILEGESIAILNALETLGQRGLSNVIFETDFKSEVDAIHHLCASEHGCTYFC
ncbi:uncharacterized protein LOC123896226 [Trifolium pratense]|uniref:uncharacterized protein LOC123896226 n=1 Tax=Trifolium pratense TaxID=57577 RepID=UPI001E698211|nr:uncharacterized protein LOC123896226 [Trifolium pratense]